MGNPKNQPEVMVHEDSHDNSWQAPPLGGDPPPQFTDRDEDIPVASSSHEKPPAHDAEGSPVQKAQQAFPSVGEIPVANVSPMTAHLHLALLQRFCALYEIVESKGTEAAEKAKLVQRFLVCAESRYRRYLSILDDYIKEFDGKNKGTKGAATLAETMPLPPWDVAIIFHVHFLTPFRFYTDMNRRSKAFWEKGISFPLERMYALIENGIWSDARSELCWAAEGKAPAYQLWETDPTSTSAELQLQDVQMTCPWCNNIQTFLLDKFTETHTTKTALIDCASCGRRFNADTLSATYLKHDLNNFKTPHDAWNIKGVISGIYDPDPEETALADLEIILQTILQPYNSSPTKLHLANYITSQSNPTWPQFINSFKKTTEELKGPRLLRLISRGNLFQSIQNAYMGIMYPDLSIDLVAASLRQREFARKITSKDCAGIDTPFALSKAAMRYHKFLLLMKRKANGKKKRVALVPTLDIDLCWHTHQLYAVSYRQWTVEHLGIAVNHDDTVGQGELDNGLKATSDAWDDAYRETYATNKLPSSSLSTKFGGKFFGRRKSSAQEDSAEPIDGAQSMYPYWLKYPPGWNFPPSCASEKSKAGWAASVDQSYDFADDGGGIGSKCAGCTGGGCSEVLDWTKHMQPKNLR